MHTKKIINGKALFVNKHISKQENEHLKQEPITKAMKQTFESNIFIRYIPKEITEEEFKTHMEKAGTVISLKLRDQEIRS